MVTSRVESNLKEETIESPTELVEIPEELKKLQTKYFGDAIVNLITQVTPKEVIKKRQARGGRVVDYVPVYWFIPQLNALFGFLWDIVVDDKGILEEDVEVDVPDEPEIPGKRQLGPAKTHKEIMRIPTQVWVNGHITINIPGRVTKETQPNGTVVETRINPIVVTKHAFGGTDIKYYKDGSGIIDIGDDYKSAEADMLKKAASYLGMCADVYGRREIGEETGPSEVQMQVLIRKGSYLSAEGNQDIVKEKLNKICLDSFSTNLKEINTDQFVRLIKLLSDGSKKRTISHAPPSGVKS